jgi:hypothetical protein
MADANEEACDAINDLNRVLDRIQSLLHGISASAEHEPNSDAERCMVDMAKDLRAFITEHAAALKTKEKEA